MRFIESPLGEGVHLVRQVDVYGDAFGPYFIFGPPEHKFFPLMTGSLGLMNTLLQGHQVVRQMTGRVLGVEHSHSPAEELIDRLNALCWRNPQDALRGRIIAGAEDVIAVFQYRKQSAYRSPEDQAFFAEHGTD